MKFCRHCGLPLAGSRICSCPQSVSADFDMLKTAASRFDEFAKSVRGYPLETLPTIDTSILDAMKGLPDDFALRVELARRCGSVLEPAILEQVAEFQALMAVGEAALTDPSILDTVKSLPHDYMSSVELAKLAGSVPEPAILDQVSELQSRMAEWDETFGARAREMGEATSAMVGAMAETVESRMQIFNAIPDLYKPMLESWREAALIDHIAPYRSTFDAIASRVAKESELWQSLRESANLRFSMVALSSLKNAIDFEPYSDGTIAALRDQLGDWSTGPWIDPTLDAAGRLDRYYELGLEPRLVQSPPAAFGRVLRITGIREEKARAPARPYLLLGAGQEDEAVGDDAMVDALQRLRSMESRMRELIDRIMAAKHGAGWFRRRTPPDVLANARDRRKERLAEGKIPHDSLLLFVDLGDLPKIICRGDNWPLFEPHFARKEAIQESFTRLNPLRADIAHSRSFSNANLLFFHAEILRLDQAMGRNPENSQKEPEEDE